MPGSRAFASLGLTLLATASAAHAAEFSCTLESPPLPHLSWGDPHNASSEVLYRRIREGQAHWSDHPELLLAIRASLEQLLKREPDNARGYIEIVRLVMDSGTINNFTLSQFAYDLAEEGLARAIALDPESAEAWALGGLFRQHRRGYVTEFGNGKSPEEALELAEQLAPRNPNVMLAWARYLAFRLRYEQAEARINQLLANDPLRDDIAATAYRMHADYLAHLNRPGPALRSAENAIELEPTNPQNWLTLSSLALEQRADTKRAIDSARTALCLEVTGEAKRKLAHALYVDWARDNSGKLQPAMDDERVVEAFELYPNVANVLGYIADHREIATYVDVFIIAGLSPEVEDPQDNLTMLHDAVQDGRVDDAERLIELGADVNRVDDRYGPLLMLASLQRDAGMVRLLLRHGADVNDNSSPWGTALIGSIMAGDEDIAGMLLDAGADTEIPNDQGETALVFAATGHEYREQPSRLVELLLDAGADPDVDFRPGQPLVDYLLDLRYREVAEQILEASRERARAAQ